ncbi:MAG: ABC transporter ATP-binding protein [Clostridia bacterium]|nr:ABC transporter ATP-binding protein [Clostridia bacterium]
MDNNKAIETCNISKYFGSFRALNNMSVSVPCGDIFGFIGKNGAGKTTFMRIVSGLIKQSSGSLAVKGQISFLPQNVRFRDNINAGEALSFFAGLRGCSADASKKLAVEMEIDLAKKINSLSPGQQRKLQIAISTIGAPEILLLDEPTAGLDPSGVQQVRGIVKKLKQNGCTIFISSHVLIELENLCDTIAVIDKGTLLYQGACGSSYEIETGGLDSEVFRLLAISRKNVFEAEGNLLIAGINRSEVPDVLRFLHEKHVKVFSVKRQGIETLYNRVVKEVS